MTRQWQPQPLHHTLPAVAALLWLECLRLNLERHIDILDIWSSGGCSGLKSAHLQASKNSCCCPKQPNVQLIVESSRCRAAPRGVSTADPPENHEQNTGQEHQKLQKVIIIHSSYPDFTVQANPTRIQLWQEHVYFQLPFYWVTK